MELHINEPPHAVVIGFSGRCLGSIDGPNFKETIDDLKAAGKTNVVVDLTNADFMDSTAIGTLIGSLTTVRKAGGDMRLAGMEKRIKNLFLLTRLLGPVFDDYETVDDALASYASEDSVAF